MREILDGKPFPKRIEKKILLKGEEIGYPLFLRSDQGSGKHEWRDTCYVPNQESLISHVISLLGWHECAGSFNPCFSGWRSERPHFFAVFDVKMANKK